MKPERWQQISQIFASAKSLATAEREEFIRQQCGGDESLRQEVEKLVASHRQAELDNFISGHAVEDVAALVADTKLEEPDTPSLTANQQFGHYQVLRKLGAGGMGEVFLATDTRLDRTVALKILPADVAADKRRMQRFRQEARVASSLNQPNIVTIFEFGEVGPLTFLATEFVDGVTLRDYLYCNKLKLTEVLDIGIQILSALDVAHDASIVHRDIKPENVMIRRRDHVVKVLDFGLAKLTEKRSSGSGETDAEAATEFKSAPGTLMGTINYMSPEQAQTKSVDQRTDIWSTGVILYEMVSGELPFKGATSAHTIVQILEKELVPLTQVDPQTPAEFERIVNKSLAKNADERYQTAKDMLIDLKSLRKQVDLHAELGRSPVAKKPGPATIEHQPVPTEPSREVASDTEQVGGWKRRAAVAVGVIGVLVLGVLIWKFWVPPSPRSQVQPSDQNVSAVNERRLNYSITVQKFRDGKPFESPFQISKEMIFERDYQIRLNITSPQAGFLYVLNEGPQPENQAPEYVVLFPSPTSNNGSALVTENVKTQIPEKSWIHFDNEKGTEKVWLVFAPKSVPELESTRAFANPKTQGLITDASVRDTVQLFLKNHSTTKTAVQQSDERKDTTLSVSGDLLVYSVLLEHQ